jgi:hypothetical protein
VSTFVYRDGAHQIRVHDEVGRELTLVSEGHSLHLQAIGEAPRLTPQMANDLADALHQWAACQLTVRLRTVRHIR